MHFEALRSASDSSIARRWTAAMRPFVGARDGTEIVVSPIYFLFGCLWPTVYSRRTQLSAVCGVALICAGDTLAAVIGTLFARRRLYNGKSVEGSLAFAVAAFLGFSLGKFFGANYDWQSALFTAGVGALLELLCTEDDNVVLPIIVSVLFGAKAP